MTDEHDIAALEEAIRHAAAGLKALQTAHDSVKKGGAIYPTHIHVAALELAHAIESSMKVALRNP